MTTLTLHYKLRNSRIRSVIQLLSCKLGYRIKTIIIIAQKLYKSLHENLQYFPYLCIEYLNPDRRREVTELVRKLRQEGLEGLLTERKELSEDVKFLRTEIKNMGVEE